MIIICGDTHFKIDEPFFSAGKEFVNWFSSQKFNNENNYLIHLGDVYHNSKPNPKVIKFVEDWFLNKLHFKKIFILAGNHGYNRERNSYAIEPLSNFKNIELIKYPSIYTISDLKLLFLPFYYPHNLSAYSSDKQNKEVYYSNLPDKFRDQYNYIFTHVEDETNHFFDEYCDLSYLKGKRISGHIHKSSKNYLGSSLITRYDERSKDNYIEIINDNGEFGVKSVPRFIDYYSIEYGNKLPEVEAKYPIWDIINAPSKKDAIKYYNLSVYSSNKQNEIYYREIFTKRKKEKLKINKNLKSRDIKEYFLEFTKLNKIEGNLKNKLLNLILSK